MKLLILSILLLCCAITRAASLDDDLQIASLDRLGDDDLEFYDDGIEEQLFEDAMERFEDDDFGLLPDEDAEEPFLEDAVARFFKDHKPRRPHRPHKKKRKGKKRRRRRFPKRLRVQLKVFRRSSGAASYKYYILQGRNIRHYRVNFRRSQQSKFLKSVQRRTRRCIIRKYRRKCLRLKLFKKGRCTTRVAKDCSGSFESFENASPKTFGKNKVRPKRKHKPRRPHVPTTPDVEEPVLPTDEFELPH